MTFDGRPQVAVGRHTDLVVTAGQDSVRDAHGFELAAIPDLRALSTGRRAAVGGHAHVRPTDWQDTNASPRID
jgi:hypothetical protein